MVKLSLEKGAWDHWNPWHSITGICIEKGKNGQNTELLCLNFLKTRNTKPLEPLYMKFCDELRELVPASSEDFEELAHARQMKASITDVMEFLSKHLKEPLTNKDLTQLISSDFGCSDRIIRDRLKEIIESQAVLDNWEGDKCRLFKKQKGKNMIYSLEKVQVPPGLTS
jgi:hypothetical protein